MNILLCSVPFRPSIGGIETVSALLADRFAALGHTVVVVTQTGQLGSDRGPVDVVRRPSLRRLLALVRWADVVVHNNISLRMAWPLLLVRRPWVIAHHTWLAPTGWAGRVKRIAMRWATNLAVSRALADTLPVPCAIVPNPYADDTFVRMAGVARRGELLYVGRLVDEKGVDVLISAVALLHRRGRTVKLTVVGDGPLAKALQRQAQVLGVSEQITFVGARSGPALAATMNAHRVLVIPTTAHETFGIAALESLACGCVPLVTRSGGLPEAVGNCGRIVARGDAVALADEITSLVHDDEALAALLVGAPSHLERHTRDRAARAYLDVVHDACRAHAPSGPARLV